MPQHVAVVFVHGINADSERFSLPMQEALRELLPQELNHLVDFRSVFWADEVRDHQRKYLADARLAGGIRHKKLRRLVVEGLGDAAAYQKTKHQDNSIYHRVQSQISAKIKNIDEDNRKQQIADCSLIFIGHSLGCHIISSYMWDLNKLKQRTEDDIKADLDPTVEPLWKDLQKASPFRRLETCAGLITLGSNMPMFTFTFGPDSVYPLTSGPKDANGDELKPAFPGVALPAALKDKARWLNFYSERDLLGFPLKSLNEDYRNAEKIHDIRVQSEAPWFIPYLWCLYAHTRYWTNRIVLRDTSQLIRDMIETPVEAASLAKV
jgi:hypothetical protein